MSNIRSDKELVEAAAKRDKEAFRELVERYQQRALRIAMDVVRTREDAEDVLQESFVKAYLSLPEFRGQSSFYTWFYRIVYNLAIDYKRKVARRGGDTREFDERTHGAMSNDLVSNIEGPQEAILRKERNFRIQSLLAELTEHHRVVVTLREIDGLSYEEIADVLGISKGTVMSRLHYARKKLQEGLRDITDFNVQVEGGLEVAKDDIRIQNGDPGDFKDSVSGERPLRVK